MENDYELLDLAKEDIEIVVDALEKKYKNFLYSKALKYSSNINIEDYINETRVTLYKAVETYKDNCSFITYLNTCLERSLSNYKKSLNTNKHKILNQSLSIENEKILDLIPMIDERYNPEKIISEEYSYIELKERILSNLTWKEELIFNLKEQNYTNKEIAEITDYNLRTIYNIINRIKNKSLKAMSN